jgi:transcriptional regulator of acetoin/glycerol metabolism
MANPVNARCNGSKRIVARCLRCRNQSQAARLLGVSRVTVWNRMRQHGIDLMKVVSP